MLNFAQALVTLGKLLILTFLLLVVLVTGIFLIYVILSA